MEKKMSTRRQRALQRSLHELREKEIIDIEKQLGREMDPTMIRKIDIAMDTGDWAATELADGIDHKVLEMRYQKYKDISDAFRRLEAGTYGVCENCGAEIPLKRLKIAAFARYCVPCLKKMEEFEEAEKGVDQTPSL